MIKVNLNMCLVIGLVWFTLGTIANMVGVSNSLSTAHTVVGLVFYSVWVVCDEVKD